MVQMGRFLPLEVRCSLRTEAEEADRVQMVHLEDGGELQLLSVRIPPNPSSFRRVEEVELVQSTVEVGWREGREEQAILGAAQSVLVT